MAIDTPTTGPGGARRLALLAVHAGVAVVTLDISLTSTALPAIAAGLGTSPAAAIWIVNAYYVAVVAALLVMLGTMAATKARARCVVVW